MLARLLRSGLARIYQVQLLGATLSDLVENPVHSASGCLTVAIGPIGPLARRRLGRVPPAPARQAHDRQQFAQWLL